MKKFDTSLYFITDSTGFTEEEFLYDVKREMANKYGEEYAEMYFDTEYEQILGFSDTNIGNLMNKAGIKNASDITPVQTCINEPKVLPAEKHKEPEFCWADEYENKQRTPVHIKKPFPDPDKVDELEKWTMEHNVLAWIIVFVVLSVIAVICEAIQEGFGQFMLIVFAVAAAVLLKDY